MASKKISQQGDIFKSYMAKLDEVGGTAAMKRGTESALKSSKAFVTPQIEKAMSTGNLPAGGKYSTAATKSSIDREMKVDWKGLNASIDVGFDFAKSGMTSIYLMYGTKGTPRHKPTKAVKGLKDAIYGRKTQKKIVEIQGEALTKVIKRIMEG